MSPDKGVEGVGSERRPGTSLPFPRLGCYRSRRSRPRRPSLCSAAAPPAPDTPARGTPPGARQPPPHPAQICLRLNERINDRNYWTLLTRPYR
eukprot:1192122-Prorocentrum_minimum.AAC.2